MADYLCEGIIINILHRLPVKTLLRCTSVCKSWYSLITAPEFISSHLKFAAASPFLLLRRCIRNSEGYDFDYKVVRITYVDCVRGKPQIELYKLSTGFWQDMSYLELDHVIYNKSRQAYVNGATHWVARHLDSYDLIVFFDMCREVFGEMPLPVSLVNNDLMRSKDLVVYMESLALILWNMNGAEPCFCVWVMKEYGVQESWIKHFSFDFHDFGGRFLRPLWVRNKGEVITVCQDGRLISYDPDGGEVKDLGVHGSRSDDYRRSIHVESYVESLILIGRGPYASDSATCKNYQLCTPVIVILSVAVEVIMSITRKEIASVAMEVTLEVGRKITLPPPKSTFESTWPCMCVLGFGFDAKNDDYKVVRVAYCPVEYGYSVPPKVEVYALSERKWRGISGKIPRSWMVDYFWSQAFVNGNVHWIAYRSNAMRAEVENVIIVFDMSNELFDEMPLPDTLTSELPYNLNTAVFGQSLGIYQYDVRVCSESCSVWVMNKYGDAKSWVKKFNIDLEGGVGMVLGVRRNGDVLLSARNGELIAYNPDTEETMKLGILGTKDSFYVCSHVESLALLIEVKKHEKGHRATIMVKMHTVGLRMVSLGGSPKGTDMMYGGNDTY
ncbi:hypothetical protein DH2020_031880 [Rehmannia glutinosa]|uniref:F-box domain-containing protein n=1 Tax=Rehmannia glutinosa TaxID=99300 RepID=A0ABR0VGX7_REHGL